MGRGEGGTGRGERFTNAIHPPTDGKNVLVSKWRLKVEEERWLAMVKMIALNTYLVRIYLYKPYQQVI